MAISDADLYRTNANGTLVMVDGVPMLEVSNGDRSSIIDMLARFDGKPVRIDVTDITKEKGRIRAQYGSKPR